MSVNLMFRNYLEYRINYIRWNNANIYLLVSLSAAIEMPARFE